MAPTPLAAPRGPANEPLGLRISFVLGILLSAVCATAAAGASLAVSSFVAPALHDLPDAEAVRAMQYVTLYRTPPALALVLLGTGGYALALTAMDLLARGRKACLWLGLGTGVYALGVVGVTLLGSMPLNDWLLSLDSAALPVDAWISYVTAWVGFNNLRILAASLASLFFVVAMLRR